MTIDSESQYRAALERLSAEESHVCLPYEAQAQQFSASIPFLRVGFERNERCLYIASENAVGTVIAALRRAGIDTDSMVRRGCLTLATDKFTLARYGDLQPGWMIGFLKQSVQGALAAGCTGLRVVCEMSWALNPDFSMDRLLEYESKVDCFLRGLPRAVMCQYDQRRFPPEVIAQVIRKHPQVVHGGLLCRNPYHIPLEELLDPKPNMHEVHRLLTNILSREQMNLELQAALAGVQRAGMAWR